MTVSLSTPRFALSREEAAASIGLGLTTFEEQVQPDLKVVRVGRRLLVPCSELEAWISDHSERILGPPRPFNPQTEGTR